MYINRRECRHIVKGQAWFGAITIWLFLPHIQSDDGFLQNKNKDTRLGLWIDEAVTLYLFWLVYYQNRDSLGY